MRTAGTFEVQIGPIGGDRCIEIPAKRKCRINSRAIKTKGWGWTIEVGEKREWF